LHLDKDRNRLLEVKSRSRNADKGKISQQEVAAARE
jgi:hypothetical protein